MSRALCVALALLYLTSSALAWEVDALPPWIRSKLEPICIDWQAWYRDGMVKPLPVPMGTGYLPSVEASWYGGAWGQHVAADSDFRNIEVVPQVHFLRQPSASDASVPMDGLRPLETVSMPTSAQAPRLENTIGPVSLRAGRVPNANTPVRNGLAPINPMRTVRRLEPVATVGMSRSLSAAETGIRSDIVSLPHQPVAAAGGSPISLPSPVASPGVSAELQPGMTAGYSLLLSLQGRFRSGELTDETLRGWLAERGVSTPALVDALDQMTLEHPMDPVYLPICKSLWENTGPGISQHLEFPYKARIIMGIYLGVLEREEDAKRLFSSVPEAWQKADPTVPMYHVACELLDWRRKSPRLCIWAWKWGATMRGAADQAFVCWHIAQACRALQDKDAVRSELLPWCESALERLGSESRWDYAIRELLWGYEFIGDRGKGIERACHWLSLAPQRGVSPTILTPARFVLAQAMARDGRAKEADELLRQVISADASGFLCNRARAEMCELRRGHADLPELGFESIVVEDAAKAGVDFGTVSVGRLNRKTFLLFSYTPISVRVRCDQAFLQASCGVSRVNERGLFERRIICTIDSSKLVPGNLSARLSIETEDQWGGTVELIVPVSAHLDNG